MRKRSTRMGMAIAMLAMGVMLAACHTMEGMGQDLSALGDKITGKAEEHSNQ